MAPPADSTPQADKVASAVKWTAGHWRVLIALYLGYMTKTFGETAFDLTTPGRMALLSNAGTARLLSVGTGSYVCGKLLLGGVADVLGGQVIFGGTLAGTALSFLAMSFSTK